MAEKTIDVKNLDHKEINEKLAAAGPECRLKNCLGQRFIAAGMSGKKITIEGVPGNALGAYLNGSFIEVCSNAQDAVGDTMNDWTIAVRGNIGDAAGYAMRGGRIFVKGNAGYRAGIHMKAYKEKKPVMVIGGCTGSFLGEYQAGGVIVVLGLSSGGKKIVGNFPCTGMHGGKMFLKGSCDDIIFPDQVTKRKAQGDDLDELKEYVAEFCRLFDMSFDSIMDDDFTLITPDTKNPYKQMYVPN